MAPPKKRPPQKKPSGDGSQDKNPQEASGADESAESGASAGEGQPKATSKSAEERKAKREAARQERIAAARKREQARKRKRAMIAIAVLIALGGGIWFSIQRSRDQAAAYAAAAEEAGCTDIQEFEDEGARHLGAGETFADYATNPPTSGPHQPQPAPWGSYGDVQDADRLVHNLEHGGIVIHHNGLTDEEVDEVDDFTDDHVNGIISVPNPDIDAPIVLAAWQHMQECQELNLTAIEGFIDDRCDKGPEKVGTTCQLD